MILIHGGGVTALVLERLLEQRGLDARRAEAPPPPPGPVLLVAADTLALLAKLFADPGLPDLGHPVPRRVVLRPGEEGASLAAEARSIPLAALIARLGRRAAPPAPATSPARHRIDATGRAARLARALTALSPTRFGARRILAARLPGRAEAAVLEFTARGWLFLFPAGPREVIVQAMVPDPPADPAARFAAALAESRLVRRHAAIATPRACAAFDAAPAILPVLGSDRWLAVGAAATALDPLCGDGVGFALQGARLAAAVLAGAEGAGYGALLDHYQKRQQRSFARHLQNLAGHYASLRSNPAWARELHPTDAFLASPAAARLLGAELGYALCDGRLVARSAADAGPMLRAAPS